MFNIPVILGSTRRGRQSLYVAQWLHRKLQATGRAQSELLDLAEYNFPIMEERLRMRDDAPPRVVEFSEKLQQADSLVIVSPEYNHGYPGVLKNALDYFWPEYSRKPIGLVTVSAGGFGGLQALQQLRNVTIGLGAFAIPASLPISKVQETFNPDGTTKAPQFDKRADTFLDELLWFTEAIVEQKKRSPR